MCVPGDLGRVFDIVHLNLPTLQKARGKDVIVLFGVGQGGKSTAANALRGVSFKWRPDPVTGVPGLFIESTPSNFVLAQMGTGNKAETIVPAFYDETIPGSSADDPYPYCFVDSRGSSELISDAESETQEAASVLLDAIIRNAASVRLVALASWSYLESMPDCGRLLKSIGKWVRNDNVPFSGFSIATQAQAHRQEGNLTVIFMLKS
jgi:hypothetical protein